MPYSRGPYGIPWGWYWTGVLAVLVIVWLAG